MRKTPFPISGVLFFWAGFVCSISFMEAWLKFRAPGVTLPVGLSIGKMIFTALNRTEWVFVLILAVWTIAKYRTLTTIYYTLSGTALFILAIQTFYLLPELNERAEIIMNGGSPPESYVHMFFGIAEITKVLVLLYLGMYLPRLPIISKKSERFQMDV